MIPSEEYFLQLNSHMVLHQSQRESTEILRSNTAEMRDLLYQILTSQQEIRRVAEMQDEGEHVAEPIMEAGQLVCFPSIFKRLDYQACIEGNAPTTGAYCSPEYFL